MKGGLLPRARVDGLVIRKLVDETLVYDLERNKAHCLNETAAMVWNHCDGKTTAERTAKTLTDQFGVRIDVDLVWLAIEQLQRFHLVEKTERLKIVLPAVSRRQLILKYAPAALALPVIMSIVAPTRAGITSNCAKESETCSDNIPCCAGLFCQPDGNICQQQAQ